MNHRIIHLLLLLSVVALLCLCSGCRVSDDPLPRARQGVVDLSALDLQQADPIRLDGDWEFYWKQLLTPADFKAGQPPQTPGYLALPAAWNDTLSNGRKRESAGYATFRLRILPGPARQELTLQLGELYSAYRLWVNGRLCVENGVIGKNSTAEIPAQAIRQTRLQLDGQPLELLLQVSNYHHRSGGVVGPIRLGATEKLESAQLKQWALALLCIGSLLVMGFYHIGLYGIRKKDRAPLYFGIYSLLWAGSSLTSNATDWAVNLLVAHYPPWFINRFDLICFVLSLPVGYSFFRTLYPAEFSRRLQQITLFVALVATVLGLILPTMAFTTIVPAFYLFAMAMILYCLVMLLRAMRTGREAAVLILAGFLVMGATGINDMLYDLQLIQSVYLIHIGMFIFIFFQAIALSFRFSRSFYAVEQLSGELFDKNRTLEDEMAERTRLEREIVNISEEERRRISHQLHDGLCQLLTGTRLHFSSLRRQLSDVDRQKPEVAEVSSLLEESVNHAYDLSRGLWPVEHDCNALSPSLEELTRRMAEASGILIEFRQQRTCQACTNKGVTQLYRIAQEALTNAVKHARASRIVVELACLNQGQLTLTVQDNGVGRDQAKRTRGGLGMGIMAHRARLINGNLTVTDAAGGGTLVSCIIPCDLQTTEGCAP
ncbi:Signal transduction histidine kinase [Trichlorobacter thiogenes]|uniref:histidine kinase n=1 Tax=Trichlorobacter thiogenes TaxID=115783 RepID=A0A1T4NT02_9BACT|nr:sensor histidine kinase [Trichlorobacter thiogenes]SJZ82212.1 Signal transduction histidine kinase [Trichlorobacter thiogenes]